MIFRLGSEMDVMYMDLFGMFETCGFWIQLACISGTVRCVSEGVRRRWRDGADDDKRQVGLVLSRLSVRTAVRPGELPDRYTSCSKVQRNPSFELHPVSVTCLELKGERNPTTFAFTVRVRLYWSESDIASRWVHRESKRSKKKIRFRVGAV